MSKRGQEVEKDLEIPKTATVVTVASGAYHNELPSVILSYVGMDIFPHTSIALNIDAVAIEGVDPDIIGLSIFVPPPANDEFSYAEIFNINLQISQDMYKEFFDNVQKINKFAIVISTDIYYYRAIVSFESSEVINDKYDDRLLH